MKTPVRHFLLLAGAICTLNAVTAFSQSVDVNYDGVTYAVTYETLLAGSSSSFQTLEAQPWWGNSAESKFFANTVGAQLGDPFDGVQGPDFAYLDDQGSPAGWLEDGTTGPVEDDILFAGHDDPFAIATEVPDSASAYRLMGISTVILIFLRRYIKPQSAAVQA